MKKLTLYDHAPKKDWMYDEVISGLQAVEKSLPSKFFYDETGSKLFDRICELEEYYPARTALAILERHGKEMAQCAGRGCLLIEYGSGSSVKTRYLLDHLESPAGYVPVDISRAHLLQTAQRLADDYAGLHVIPVCADFTRPLHLPKTPEGRRVVFFPGSTIGNLTVIERHALLHQTAQLCGPGGGLILGVDLQKDPRIITAAYNDKDGVTAEFNLNILRHINRALDANFEVDRFWHHAFYTPREGRIEMHLISQCEQEVRINGCTFCIREGESIRTEYSHKFTEKSLVEMAENAGFRCQKLWTDERRYFAIAYFTVEPN
ncbi:MAG: dimethylhistidine N-methyltransferase [Gemmatales bacterium]|nr:MAG: dimethylhistidine N-methyltransferase [Gemmatales bacterium]